MKYFFILLTAIMACFIVSGQTINEKVDSVLNRMTLEEKIGQMTQVERTSFNSIDDISTMGIGSILSGGGSAPEQNSVSAWAAMYDNFQSKALKSRLGIPLIYGIDAVHGHNNLYGAVIFPHNIGLGCTWNAALVKQVHEATAEEVAATGIDWTFAPCIAVPQNEKWGRTYEGFGETAEIQKIMAASAVVGLQGTNLADNKTILGCAKHFVGDGGTTGGIDQGNAQVTEEILRNIHMPGYIDAIEAGVGSVMASYNSWNGVKLHGHDFLLNDVLKDELGFEGFVISDWAGVDQVDGDYRTAIKRAINAGIDMVMVPDRYEVFINHLLSLVRDNEVPVARIDDAVRRILKQKYLLNLFEEPYADPGLVQAVGSQAHRTIAKQAVRESMVLLNAKNNILPLQKNGETILVAGQLANDLGAQCGGWSISWQGDNGAITTGTTLLQGMKNLTESSEIIYSANGTYSGTIDKAIVVVGEKTPYAEGAGDKEELYLDQTDIELLKNLKQQGIPTIAVLISGRPIIISNVLRYTDAIIAAWYPGTEGDGVAEFLFGVYNPTGKLTHSWPKELSQIPINFGDANYDPLFAYKHGLTAFPSAATADSIYPYAASTNVFGDTIFVAFSASLQNFISPAAGFNISINGTLQPGLGKDFSLATYDNSILKIALSDYVSHEDNIAISYTGTNIGSGVLQLSHFNDFYVYNASNSNIQLHTLPGRIEAENYSNMFGIQTELCSDLGGGLNVAYIESGDWMEYLVNVSQPASYKITARIAGFSNGQLKITFNNATETFIPYQSTDGWQNWQSYNRTVYLDPGTYTMKVEAQTDAFNINYFDIDMTSHLNESKTLVRGIGVYPNPVQNNLNVRFSSSNDKWLQIKLIDASGKFSMKLYEGLCSEGENTLQFDLKSELKPGIYFIEIKDAIKRYFTKVVVK